jgi:transposase
LERNLSCTSSAHLLFGNEPSWWLLQDNDPKHALGLVKHLLFSNSIQCIAMLPYSPDINPMENLWSDMNRRVGSRLAQTIEDNTSALLLSKLVASMPARCKAIGHETKY